MTKKKVVVKRRLGLNKHDSDHGQLLIMVEPCVTELVTEEKKQVVLVEIGNFIGVISLFVEDHKNQHVDLPWLVLVVAV